MQTKEYRREYYLKNKEKKVAQYKLWKSKNPEKVKAIKNRWRAKNKDRTNFLARRYIYRRKHAEGKITFEQEKQLYAILPTCLYCNKNKSDTIDHLTPLSRGGTNNIDNLVAACRSCNSRKGAKTMYEFAPILGVMLDRINV